MRGRAQSANLLRAEAYAERGAKGSAHPRLVDLQRVSYPQRVGDWARGGGTGLTERIS